MADTHIDNDFNYINQLRISAQLKPFLYNTSLATAALNHATYLTANKRQGHHEQQSLNYFTGEWAADRAIATQYENRSVGENIASKSGEKLFFNPVDNLMSAIYHRFGFLDLNNNEIGIGHQLGDNNSYVYVMGNSNLSLLCQQPSFSGFGTYNYNICSDTNKKIDKKLVDRAKQNNQTKNPKMVLWPAKNTRHIPPAFYQESPDPLPLYDVSGYPISIQFNPSFYKIPPKIISFNVHKTKPSMPLKAITIMNKANDPNDKFSAYQHAFFPEKRLEWDTTYTVNIEYSGQGNQINNVNWSFQTKSFDVPIYTVTQSNKKIKVDKGHGYILYFPPQNAQDVRSDVKTRDYNMQLKLNYIDKNTLKVFINNHGKADINFHNKTVELFTQ